MARDCRHRRQGAIHRRRLLANAVTDVPAASAPEAEAHFAASFRFETDCWDVHDALSRSDPGFVLLDVRGPDLFAKGHVPGAINAARQDHRVQAGIVADGHVTGWTDEDFPLERKQTSA